MNNKLELMQKYAKLIVYTGANVQKDQIVELFSSIENAPFAEIVIEECYKAGAKFVLTNWVNEKASVIAYKYASTEVLRDIKPYTKAKYDWIAENKATRIFFEDEDPNAFKDIDSKKIAESQKDITTYVKKLFDPIEGEYQWCIAGVPTKAWAKQVFPKVKNENKAVDKLWDLIFKVCRINKNDDPNELWAKHNSTLNQRCKTLNELNLDYVEYKNSSGTDLQVYLADDHVWKGGMDKTKAGIEFYPNLPTEEVFSMPHSQKINSKLVSTFPLSYNGVLIKNMVFEFKDGKVVNFDASEGKETLKHLLEMDEGACRLGEIALVSYNSPIRNSETLFFSTLFDENASCHFAFGECYNDTIKGGLDLTQEEIKQKGGNESIIHVDFMVGSKDLSIIGTTKTGEKVKIFENGNFVL